MLIMFSGKEVYKYTWVRSAIVYVSSVITEGVGLPAKFVICNMGTTTSGRNATVRWMARWKSQRRKTSIEDTMSTQYRLPGARVGVAGALTAGS